MNVESAKSIEIEIENAMYKIEKGLTELEEDLKQMPKLLGYVGLKYPDDTTLNEAMEAHYGIFKDGLELVWLQSINGSIKVKVDLVLV